MTTASTIVATQLRGDLDGQVIGPSDPGYDEARAVFPGGFDRRPAAIVRPGHASEVAQVVSFARDEGLDLAAATAARATASWTTVSSSTCARCEGSRSMPASEPPGHRPG